MVKIHWQWKGLKVVNIIAHASEFESEKKSFFNEDLVDQYTYGGTMNGCSSNLTTYLA